MNPTRNKVITMAFWCFVVFVAFMVLVAVATPAADMASDVF